MAASAGAVDAANLAMQLGWVAAGSIWCVAALTEELSFLEPMLETLTVMREMTETAVKDQQKLTAIAKRCTHHTACFVVKCRRNLTLDISDRYGCDSAQSRTV